MASGGRECGHSSVVFREAGGLSGQGTVVKGATRSAGHVQEQSFWQVRARAPWLSARRVGLDGDAWDFEGGLVEWPVENWISREVTGSVDEKFDPEKVRM